LPTTNSLIKITSIPTISKYAHEDNIMMSAFLQRPLEFGADISYYSGRKYLSGHHDLMAGVIGFKNTSISDELFYCVINTTGCGLSPLDS
jgi:cystathionine beta-lyase